MLGQKLPILAALITLLKGAVAPNIAESNPWNVEESTAYYERFHPSEFEPVMRNHVRVLLQEFEQVAFLLESKCLASPPLDEECRQSILRGGVLLRHIHNTGKRCTEMVRLIHEFRKDIGRVCYWDDHLIVEMQNLLHQMHYDLQRPKNRDTLMILAQSWQRMPRIFRSD
jgi:hypothetical protein